VVKVTSIILFLLLISNFRIGNADVALDVGHLYKSPGAISVSGVPEILYNKEVAEKVKARLEGSDICLFLIEDKPLLDRPKIANESATVFVSIHHDSVGKATSKVTKRPTKSLKATTKIAPDSVHVSGFSIFISKLSAQYNDSLRLAKCIGAELIDAGFLVGLYHKNSTKKQRLLVDKCFGVYRADKFAVLKNSKIPAILVECGVISNAQEEKFLNENRDKMADAIALGLQRYIIQNGRS